MAALASGTSVRVVGGTYGDDSYCEYMIRVEALELDGDGAPVFISQARRRYSQFRVLHEDCFHLIGDAFPAQKRLFNSTAVVSERVTLLDAYLKRLLALALQAPTVPAALGRFLNLPSAPTNADGVPSCDALPTPVTPAPLTPSASSADAALVVPSGDAAATAVAAAVSCGALHGFRLPELFAKVAVLGWSKVEKNPNTQYELLLTLAPRDGAFHRVFSDLHESGRFGLRVLRHYDHLEWLDKRLRADERFRKRMEAHSIWLPREGRPRRATDPSSWFTARPDAGARAPALVNYLQALIDHVFTTPDDSCDRAILFKAFFSPDALFRPVRAALKHQPSFNYLTQPSHRLLQEALDSLPPHEPVDAYDASCGPRLRLEHLMYPSVAAWVQASSTRTVSFACTQPIHTPRRYLTSLPPTPFLSRF